MSRRSRKRPSGPLHPSHFNPTAEYEVVAKLEDGQPTYKDPRRAHEEAGDPDFQVFNEKCWLCQTKGLAVEALKRAQQGNFETKTSGS